MLNLFAAYVHVFAKRFRAWAGDWVCCWGDKKERKANKTIFCQATRLTVSICVHLWIVNALQADNWSVPAVLESLSTAMGQRWSEIIVSSTPAATPPCTTPFLWRATLSASVPSVGVAQALDSGPLRTRPHQSSSSTSSLCWSGHSVRI